LNDGEDCVTYHPLGYLLGDAYVTNRVQSGWGYLGADDFGGPSREPTGRSMGHGVAGAPPLMYNGF